jgi:hypothetical protein
MPDNVLRSYSLELNAIGRDRHRKERVRLDASLGPIVIAGRAAEGVHQQRTKVAADRGYLQPRLNGGNVELLVVAHCKSSWPLDELVTNI